MLPRMMPNTAAPPTPTPQSAPVCVAADSSSTSAAQIVVRNLSYRYPAFDPAQSDADMPWVLQDISLEVAAGECLGIVGTTSSGKSTLCLALIGLVPQQTGGTIRGEVHILGRDTRRTSVAHLASDVGIVFQDPEANLLGLTIEDEVAFGMENLGVPPDEMYRRVTWALDAVGMGAAELRQRSATHLSGGQKQRVGIAAVLAMQPRVLVLDEPTAELDPIGRQEVLQVVANLRARQPELAVVLVERDATALVRLAERLLVLDAGVIVASGSPHDLFAPQQAGIMEARGIAIPEMAQIAARLNRGQQQPTPYTFVTLDGAISTLQQRPSVRSTS